MERLLCARPKAQAGASETSNPPTPQLRLDAESHWTEEEAVKVQRGKALAQGHSAG